MTANLLALGAIGLWASLAALGVALAHVPPFLLTGLSLLIWFVFAPQCLATLAVVRKETGGWAMPVTMATFLFALAYGASFITYRLAAAWG